MQRLFEELLTTYAAQLQAGGPVLSRDEMAVAWGRIAGLQDQLAARDPILAATLLAATEAFLSALRETGQAKQRKAP